MLRLIVFLSFILIPCIARAQTDMERKLLEMNGLSMIRANDTPFKFCGICGLTDSVVLDRTRLNVMYDVTAQTDSTKTYRMHDCAILQIGETYTKFFGLTTWRYDLNFTRSNSGKPQIAYDDIRDQIVDYEVFFDNSSQRMIVHNHVTLMQDILYAYEEPLPHIDWSVEKNACMISGYACYRAEADYKGRKWIVWFTPEIAVSCGPWQLQGLPGLIVCAEDSRGHYRFSLKSIENSAIPIVKYKIRTKWLPREQWLVFDSKIHKHPVDMLENGGQTGIILDNPRTGEMVLNDRTWNIPHNPIELE